MSKKFKRKEQSTERNAWVNMINRCYKSNTVGYKNWGGRGIRVCQRWLESYENFLTDMGRKPGCDYSLDRINNNGNYESKNCHWADRETQAFDKKRKFIYNIK